MTTQHTLPYAQPAYGMSAYHQVPTTPSYPDPYAANTHRASSIHQISSSAPTTPDPYAASPSSPPFLSPSLSNPSKYNSFHGSTTYPASPLSAGRSPYMSTRQHAVAVLLPLLGFLAILVSVRVHTLVTQRQPHHRLEITSIGFYRFGIQYPSLLVAVFTLVASVLNAMLAWCFAQSCIIRPTSRLQRQRPAHLATRHCGLLGSQRRCLGNAPIWDWLDVAVHCVLGYLPPHDHGLQHCPAPCVQEYTPPRHTKLLTEGLPAPVQPREGPSYGRSHLLSSI